MTPVVTIQVETIHELSLQGRQKKGSDSQENKFYLRLKMLLSKIVGRYKMQTAKKINKFTGRTGRPLWQRN
jgi:hypothetical protein